MTTSNLGVDSGVKQIVWIDLGLPTRLLEAIIFTALSRAVVAQLLVVKEDVGSHGYHA